MNNKEIERIKSVSYAELTEKEKIDFADYFSNEEEFSNLKNLYLGIAHFNKFDAFPNSKVKQDLDELYDQVYDQSKPKNRLLSILFPPLKPIFQKPGVQIALASFLVVFGMFIYNTLNVVSISEPEPSLLAVNEKRQNERTNERDKNQNTKEKLANTRSKEESKLTDEKQLNVHGSESFTSINNQKESIPSTREDLVAAESLVSIDFEASLEAVEMEDEYFYSKTEEAPKILSLSDNIELLDLLSATY